MKNGLVWKVAQNVCPTFLLLNVTVHQTRDTGFKWPQVNLGLDSAGGGLSLNFL